MKHLLPVLLTLAAACAQNAKEADSPDEAVAAAKGELQAGTTVCIAELVGVRFELEDLLVQHELKPEAECMFAEVRMEETGEPSAWVLRYQRIGDSAWSECKSDESARSAFAVECIGQMISDLGGS